MNNMDAFDQNAHVSPMLNAQQDAPLFSDALGLNQFTLNDQQVQQSAFSPAHSPHISPQLMPQQQALPEFTPENNYGLSQGMGGQFGNMDQNGYDMFPTTNQDTFAQVQAARTGEGMADQMSPPEINIDFAPPSQRQNFDQPQQSMFDDALSPPENGKSSPINNEIGRTDILTDYSAKEARG